MPQPRAGTDGPCLHDAVGGTATWRRLAEAFYSRVARDPRLRPLFPGKTLHCAIEELTAFLVQLFDGPIDDTQRRWWLSLRESHRRFKIGPEERAAWLENMTKALDEVQIGQPFRGALRDFFERSSTHVVNSGEPARAAEDLTETPSDEVRREIAQRWETQRTLDEAVAAVRRVEADRAIATAGSLRNQFGCSRSVFAGLLALMAASRNAALLRYVQEQVTEDPALLQERYASRTLLHNASAQGNLPLVELFLRLGADPNAHDGGGHTPLYCVANECKGSDGAGVVRTLVQSGADVNAGDGVKHCTALHMAARRGNMKVAEALLDCGAAIDARDSLGETPLRRAVNCNKLQVASLLLARGADVHSIGSKGLTPLGAARTIEMKRLLRLRE